MKKIYAAANLQEAHIILNLLDNICIKAFLLNENAQGGLGEIPFTHVYPEVWVENENDTAKARDVINAYEKSEVSTNVSICSSCRTENPDNFQLCWKCSESLV